MWKSPSKMSAVLGLGASLALAGCGAGVVSSVGDSLGGAELVGYVHGGQQPIIGANVYLYAAGTTGYGTGATSLLNGAGYVMTDAGGNFTISNDYTCPTANAQVYLVASGGNTGSGVNKKSVLLSAMGTCANLQPSTFIDFSDVSTVASVYALAQFMTPGSTAIGTSSTNVTGMVNAFNTVANLVDVSTGAARTITPSGNGKVPRSTINTLANIIAACVNTTGGVGPCAGLFSAATPAGGTTPTDTLSAILDVALNPGHNVVDLYSVLPPKSTFQPSLTGVPNDWTLSIEFTGGGLNAPQLPAVDAIGNIWVPNAVDPGTISEFSPTGVPLTSFKGGGLSYPEAVAVDLSGNVWTANEGNSTVSEHTSGGSPLSGSGFSATGLLYPYAIALDAAGDVFTANGNSPTGGTVTKLGSNGAPLALFTRGGLDNAFSLAIDASQNVWVTNNAGRGNSGVEVQQQRNGGLISGYTGGGMAGPVGIAIDKTGNAWIANFNNASVSELNSTGTPLSGAGYVTPSDVSALSVDGNNTVWTANTDGSISRLANSGAAISPATGYVSAGATGEVGIVVDASGNVWTTDNYVAALFEYVGAASPVMVPLQAAVKNNMLGQRP